MRNQIILLLICFFLKINVQSQVISKDLKNNSPIILNKTAPLIQLNFNMSYYILDPAGRNIWAAELRSGKVVMEKCFTDDKRWRWDFVSNSDGTYTINTQFDPSKKLVYEKSKIRLPQSSGISGSTSVQDGFYVRQNPATSTAVTVNSKWRLNLISNDLFWLVFENRSDSFQIKTIHTGNIPLNGINFTFSSLSGWEQSSASFTKVRAFDGQPSGVNHIPFFTSPVVPPMPLGGSYWRNIENDFFSFSTKTDERFINTARPGTNRWQVPDETRKGVLTSMPFVICSEKITFKIAGTENANEIKFELLQKINAAETGSVSFPDGHYRIIRSFTGHNNDIARMIIVNTNEQYFKICRFRITDNSATGHIIVDNIDLFFTGQQNSDPVPTSPVIPTSKPIWGAIDMHTHPMSYLGMGGKLMHGRLDGNPAQALGNCNCTHGGWGSDNTCGNYLRAEIINLIDEHYDKVSRRRVEDIQVPHNDHPHEGFPALTNWPAQNSMTHQQMWYEWMRRARDGGLKSIIALTVNSEILGRALGGDSPIDDKTSADRQIDELIAFVRRNSSFLDTVTSSARMRQVINEGRMAVIIGMEIDNIGNFYQNISVTKDQIRNEITRLKNKGVRYIFPIHITDNKFGGSAIYKELFNLSNKYATGQPITGTVPVEFYPPVLPGNLFNVESAADRNISFRLKSGMMLKMTRMRPLLDLIDAGGFPILPPPLDVPSLVIKPIVDPILLTLRLSQQYQLAKKIFFDIHPEWYTYDRIVRSPTDPGGHRNVLGLSEEGIFAIKEMMRQGLMIDIDHASEKSVNEMLRIASLNDYPVNSGHNGLRGRGDNEKTRTREQLETISNLGGMFGMGWENQNPNQFSTNFGSHLTVMGGKNTTFGSDIDGYAATPLKPVNSSKFINYTNRSYPDFLTTCTMAGSSRTWNYNTEGMVHMGLYPDFFEALKKDGMSSSNINQLFLASEYFARMWEKCERRAPLVER